MVAMKFGLYAILMGLIAPLAVWVPTGMSSMSASVRAAATDAAVLTEERHRLPREYPVQVSSTGAYFFPNALTIRVGDMVGWFNPPIADTHSVRELSSAAFDEVLAPGTTWRHRFIHEGEFEYGCRLHPWMRGHVTVLPFRITTTRRTMPPSVEGNFADLVPFGKAVLMLENRGGTAFSLSTEGVAKLPLAWRPTATTVSGSDDDRIWLLAPNGRAVVRIWPGGSDREVELPDRDVSMTALAPGVHGELWLFDERDRRLGRFEPETRNLRWLRQGLPVQEIQRMVATRTKVFILESDGRIRAYDQRDGQEVSLALPPDSRAQAIAADGDLIWYTDRNRNKIVEILDDRIIEYTIPSPGAGLGSLAIAPDRSVWFIESALGKVGRVAGSVTEFDLGGATAPVTAIAVDRSLHVWLLRPDNVEYFSIRDIPLLEEVSKSDGQNATRIPAPPVGNK
jgi:plastocyanin/streptogramin lyase